MPKILVADDDPSILTIVSKTLTKAGYEVTTAEDGEQAIEKATVEKPDAILLDITMPKLDGIQVCARLKSYENTKNIPVGFITAHTDQEHYQQAVGQGGALYINKPFRPDKLVSMVGLLLTGR